MASPPPPPSSSPLVGLVAVPLTLVAGSLLMVRGGPLFSPPSLPWQLLHSPPSPSHALPALKWVVAPRDFQIAAGLERLVLVYFASGLVQSVLNLFAPKPKSTPKPTAANLDPRKQRSAIVPPSMWILAALALHITAMRVLALRSSPGYAETVDARALLGKKATGPPFQDVAAMMGGLVGLLLAFRELGNVADRTGEFFSVKLHRNVAHIGHIVTGCARFFFAVAVFRTCVVPPVLPH